MTEFCQREPKWKVFNFAMAQPDPCALCCSVPVLCATHMQWMCTLKLFCSCHSMCLDGTLAVMWLKVKLSATLSAASSRWAADWPITETHKTHTHTHKHMNSSALFSYEGKPVHFQRLACTRPHSFTTVLLYSSSKTWMNWNMINFEGRLSG